MPPAQVHAVSNERPLHFRRVPRGGWSQGERSPRSGSLSAEFRTQNHSSLGHIALVSDLESLELRTHSCCDRSRALLGP